jgi:GrpB-like predicted nucleotidyltransferase (UPF0157 family)
MDVFNDPIAESCSLSTTVAQLCLVRATGTMPHIKIVPYDSTWPQQYAEERHRLDRALAGIAVRIEHNGSTSVPGLVAKPIIDIQISVAALQPMAAYGEPLCQLGYVHIPHEDDAFCPFFRRTPSYHIHVVEAGGREELRTLAFRDYLRAHPEIAREYAALKESLAPSFSADDFASQQAYAEAKGAFIERIISVAQTEGYPFDVQSPVA